MKIGYVYLKGGLGNQLFQFAFANYLKSLNYKVLLTDNLYTDNTNTNITKRDLIFDISDFGFKKTSNSVNKLFIIFDKFFQSRRVKKIFKPKKNIIYNFIKDNDFHNYNNKSLITVFDGYWQELDYIQNSKIFLTSSLQKETKISESLASNKIKGSTMVHIRRQDYLKLGHDLNEEYYINALTKAKSLIKDFHFDVFTDDEEWVKSKLIFHDSKNIYSPKTINENKFQIIDTFSKMLKYQNFIIANSSFSYMAAHLGSTKTSKVLYPKPWFRNKDKNISIDSTWIPIKAV